METRHIVVDMQRMFAEETSWHAPVVAEILPNVVKLCAAHTGRNLFAKFMLPGSPMAASGAWRTYYHRWSTMTTECLSPNMQDLVSELDVIAAPAMIIEKDTYSVFQVPGFSKRLKADGVERLVFSGVETDVCVLASVFDAVDAGFHVVVATDAVGSGSPAAHDAVLNAILPRLAEQIELVETARLL